MGDPALEAELTRVADEVGRILGEPRTQHSEQHSQNLLQTAVAKPVWAFTIGQDQYGRYADLVLQVATQRFRWIEPGVFRRAVARPWYDVQKFIATLNSMVPGLNAKLPTEAQWEYACRAGTHTPFAFGGNITPEQVNYDGSRPYAQGKQGQVRQKTVPVKTLPANSWGLYEMHGNVWEWCQDAWLDKLSKKLVVDPENLGLHAVSRVLHGGSWNDEGASARSAIRIKKGPAFYDTTIGFRLALGS